MTHLKKKLALHRSFETDPLIKGIEEKFEIIISAPAECAQLLLSNKVDIALIPPIEYAKHYYDHNLCLIPDFCLAGKNESKNAILIIAPGKDNISTIGFNLGIISEIVLTKILFSENYNIQLKFVNLSESVDESLTKVDAVILTGNQALEMDPNYSLKMYLSEEWFDITELPFVYGLWVIKEGRLVQEEIDLFKELIKQNIEIASEKLNSGILEDNSNSQLMDYFNSGCGYRLNEEEKESLERFFEYAFSYGMIEDIPDLVFV